MYLFEWEVEGIAAAICKENDGDGGGGVSGGDGEGVQGSNGAKIEKVNAGEAVACNAETAERQVNMHDNIQRCSHADMGCSWRSTLQGEANRIMK